MITVIYIIYRYSYITVSDEAILMTLNMTVISTNYYTVLIIIISSILYHRLTCQMLNIPYKFIL